MKNKIELLDLNSNEYILMSIDRCIRIDNVPVVLTIGFFFSKNKGLTILERKYAVCTSRSSESSVKAAYMYMK